ALIENSLDGIVILNGDGTLRYQSPSMKRILGHSLENKVGMNGFEYTHPDDLPGATEAFAQLLQKPGGTMHAEVRGRHQDGSWHTLEVAGKNLLDDPVVGGVVVNLRDITERKRAEEALQKQKYDLGERVKELSCLYGISDLIGKQGISLEEILQGVVELIPSGWQYPEATCARIVLDGQQFRTENFRQTAWSQASDIIAHGDQIGTVEACYLEERLEEDEGPFLNEERSLLNAIAERVGRIIERKRAEEALQEYSEHLEEMVEQRTTEVSMANDQLRGEINERKEMEAKLQELYEQERDLRQQLETEISKRVEFTRVLAHELKTALTPVLVSSQMLASKIEEEPLRSMAGNINRSACNLNSRIDELLDLAKGEIGMLELKLEQVDLLQLLREVADTMSSVPSSRGQSLIVDLPSSLPPVQADNTRLRQVVANLLTNAMKFTPKGGRIALRARQKDAAVVVEVQDTGRGISKSDQERLFKPYHRVESDRERFSGLGLGLSLCKTLVELHGGEIWVSSYTGKGSTFGFSLPLEDGGQGVLDSSERGKLWRVLIIEDDQEILNCVSLAFQTGWPEAELVSTQLGEEGVEMVETEAPDVVILDLGLPDISGLETLRQIRLFSAVPVVILTVKAEEKDIVRGLELGADDYLGKPFGEEELLARLKAQLRKQTPSDEEAPMVCGLLHFDPSSCQLRYGRDEISLTVIEGRIIQCLMTNAGHVVTHSSLAEAVWGEDYPRSAHSLSVNIRRIREKLEVDPSNPEIVLTKAGIGYWLAKPV
ncbi:MAG: ATP-binding protein, partial [Dehalococcoidia bacterium]